MGEEPPGTNIPEDTDDDRQLIELLSPDDRAKLTCPAGVGDFQRGKLERDAKKNWDLFYRRNGDRFFKRRYWTRREFHELLDTRDGAASVRYLFEVGCGCGDFALPLLDNQRDAEHSNDCNPQNQDHDQGRQGQERNRDLEELPRDLFIYCCDISNKAIELLKSNEIYRRYQSSRIKAFVANITTDNVDELLGELEGHKMDLMSLVFVLSALDPSNMPRALGNLSACLRPGGLVFFRDYAICDKAMLRFNEKSKIQERFYVRQDGTRAYFFTKLELVDLFEGANFSCDSIDYVKRETINNATQSSHSRIFLQAKFRRK